MYSMTLGNARKYGAKVAAGVGSLVGSVSAFAADGEVATAVVAEITKFKTDGTAIAIAMVVAVLTIALIYKLARR